MSLKAIWLAKLKANKNHTHIHICVCVCVFVQRGRERKHMYKILTTGEKSIILFL